MINRTHLLAGFCLLLFMAAAEAEVRYVTDDLQLALYEQPGSKGKLLKRLASGTRLELLEEKGLFAQVRAPDGTTGWPKAGFLIKDKPARARLHDLEQRLAGVQGELKEARKRLADQQKELSPLRDEQAALTEKLAASRQRYQRDLRALARLRAEHRQSHGQQRAASVSLPRQWVLAAAGLALTLGFVLGILWLDWRIRRRHGGFRIY